MGILFFEKNKLDIDFDSVSIAVTDSVATDTGSSYLDFLRNRNNWSGWGTTGSTDAAGTELVFTMNDQPRIDNLILVGMNFAAYTIKYWDGSAYQDFSTAINVSGNTDTTKRHSFTAVETEKLKLTITGTITADDDKLMSQFIATEKIGEFSIEPDIEPLVSKNRRTIKTLSGKGKVLRNAGAFNCRMKKDNVTGSNDLTLIENLYDYHNGFLVWLSGGTESQFSNAGRTPVGFRLQDIYLMSLENEYRPRFASGRYNQGVNMDLELIEVIG